MIYMTVTKNAFNFTASKLNIPSVSHNKIHRSSFPSLPLLQCYNSYNYPWERDPVLIVKEAGWMDGSEKSLPHWV